MGLLTELRLRFRPPRRQDPDFGTLLFMYIPHAPENSYWEGEWLFPPTGSRVSIALPGGIEGPEPQARAFYLSLPARFDELLRRVRPGLEKVFRDWIGRPLHHDPWRDVQLSGFGIGDHRAVPITWDISFETIGDKWLGITIPFNGDVPQDPVVDT